MANPRTQSPLRYPGGKSCLTNFITELANLNQLQGSTYLELYAGGAGAALNMLFNGVFRQIHINDFDYAMYSFWFCVLNHTEELVEKIISTDISIDEWHNQKRIYARGYENDILELGFSTFFLNRTNRSGIIFKAGPIGGINQEGDYLLDVRFNKVDLIERIRKIATFSEQITLTNLDALKILQNINDYHPDIDNLFIYLDPPYYKKGKQLYLNNYDHQDHENLVKTINNLDPNIKWLISYDNVAEIRELYDHYRMSSFDLNYTLQSKKFGSELIVFSPQLIIGDFIIVNNRVSALNIFE
ncbi:DNA adenine methylase [Pedobacter sp. AJM]|uniref:DNA adenine methylase n=1 Tax=Pedobacter sp. AJM TaxID=2003629 RepID=UPI000B4BA116|nr:DNA adenine methylase [Pedobacter sp. AJM]OWK69274.1 hypothetical protein CBW18_18140 [Pedobacter sp. AJM]